MINILLIVILAVSEKNLNPKSIFLKQFYPSFAGKLIFDYWKCIVDLLQDEDDEIRSLIAASVFQFIQNEYPTVDQPAFLRCQSKV